MVLWCDTIYTVSHQQRLTEKKVQTLHPEDSENWQHRDLANNHKKMNPQTQQKNAKKKTFGIFGKVIF